MRSAEWLQKIDKRLKKVSGLAAAAGIVIATVTSAGWSQSIPRVADLSHADPVTAEFFNGLFAAQSTKDVDGTMANFSLDLLIYADATIGTEHSSFDALKDVFAEYMPGWGAGLTYPVRIIGGPDSAIVAFTTTPEIWGEELRILGSVDLDEGKIVRWVDYFDSSVYDAAEFEGFRVPRADFPLSFRETDVSGNASPRIVDVATRFQKALSSDDTESLGEMLTYDAVYEDMTLHAQILGKSSIEAYLSRIFAMAPFGDGATLRHVVGGDAGGGFEWIGGEGMESVNGVTALELDPEGKVSRVTTTYDGRQLGLEKAKSLAVLSVQP